MEKKLSEEEEKKIKIMQALSFFKPFTGEELVLILATSRWLKCSAGEPVVREGDTECSFYIILKGSVEVQKKTGVAHLKKTLGLLSTGQCFGEMSLVTGETRNADVIACTETYVLKIDAAVLNKDTDSFKMRSLQFKFYKIFAEILAKRLNALDREFVKLY
ncbi:MAG: cyclic nucleotide-binding domain-containing protein [Alphaproteobacteria bacterium]|uniref:Cyclic nucleotide-binding domain-containing protein n=1 Tax=Candidatus Nitrobium versatile TaxID=2884831 RepID=A0A953LZP0_9BACT|nr:cyclic nucleotide-binding domain-containing protein [Candidatus Nitrobium versatile]